MATGTPYDDVFRTLLMDCSELFLPVLNESFGERYRNQCCVVECTVTYLCEVFALRIEFFFNQLCRKPVGLAISAL